MKSEHSYNSIYQNSSYNMFRGIFLIKQTLTASEVIYKMDKRELGSTLTQKLELIINVNLLRFKNSLLSIVFSFCILILPEFRINRLLGKVVLIVVRHKRKAGCIKIFCETPLIWNFQVSLSVLGVWILEIRKQRWWRKSSTACFRELAAFTLVILMKLQEDKNISLRLKKMFHFHP